MSQYRRSSRHRYHTLNKYNYESRSLNTAEAVDIGTSQSKNFIASYLSLNTAEAVDIGTLNDLREEQNENVSIPPKQ